MSLDDRGGPRVRAARVAVTAGLMLDLEAAGAITWMGDDVTLATALPQDPLVRWACARLENAELPTEGRFVLGALYPGAWDRVGDSLVKSGLVERRARRWRRPFYRLISPATRIRVVNDSRTCLYDTAVATTDPCLDVLAACSLGEELLSGSAFTDSDVAVRFADRPTTETEEKVWLAVRWANAQSAFIGNTAGPFSPPL